MLGETLLFVFVTIWVVILIYIPYLFGMVDNVKNNWEDYRCSPTIMPISGHINKEDNLTASEATQQNFEYCTKTISSSFMDELLEPVNYINKGLINLGGDILGNLQSVRDVISNIRDAISTIVVTLIMMVLKFIIQIIKTMLTAYAILGKLTGSIDLTTGSLQASSLAIGSAWNGEPGKFIRNIAKVA
jgi:ABC-type glycerol-3-phosphate transport system permease component